MVTQKSYEVGLRRKAERQGLRLVKSRRRDPLALDYGLYMLLDQRGRPAEKFPANWQELEFVQDFLATRPEDR